MMKKMEKWFNIYRKAKKLNELDEVKKYYKILMENDWSIKDIQSYQNKYI